MPPSVCRIAGCRRKPHARGLCQKHYDQQRKPPDKLGVAAAARSGKAVGKAASAASAIAPLGQLDGKFCHVTGCTSPHHAKGYCKSHYGQIRRHGKVEDLAVGDGKTEVPLSKERRLLEIVKRHEILKKEIASIHKELESQVDED